MGLLRSTTDYLQALHQDGIPGLLELDGIAQTAAAMVELAAAPTGALTSKLNSEERASVHRHNLMTLLPVGLSAFTILLRLACGMRGGGRFWARGNHNSAFLVTTNIFFLRLLFIPAYIAMDWGVFGWLSISD